jgi:hypothetical protein
MQIIEVSGEDKNIKSVRYARAFAAREKYLNLALAQPYDRPTFFALLLFFMNTSPALSYTFSIFRLPSFAYVRNFPTRLLITK